MPCISYCTIIGELIMSSEQVRSTRDPSIQARIDQAFKAEWCHLGIFGADCATIVWCFLPPLYFLDFFNV
jgi:hypothetical protein